MCEKYDFQRQVLPLKDQNFHQENHDPRKGHCPMNSSPPQNLPYALNRTLSEILTRAIFKVCGWAHIHTSHEWCGDCNMAHGAFKTGPNLKYQACEFPYLFWSPSYTCTLHEMSSKMSVHSQCLSNGNNNDVVDTNERRTCGEWQVGPLFKNSAPYNWPNTPDKFWSKMDLPYKCNKCQTLHVGTTYLALPGHYTLSLTNVINVKLCMLVRRI